MHESILIIFSMSLAYIILVSIQKTTNFHAVLGTLVLGLINEIWIATIVHEYWASIITITFSNILLFGAIYDSQHYILPDQGAILLSILGVIQLFISGHDIALGIGIMIVVYLFGIFLVLYSHGGFGLGDVKWLTAISLWLSPWGIYCMIFLSFNLGCLYLIFYWFRTKELLKIMPFGPFISIGAWISFVYGDYLYGLF